MISWIKKAKQNKKNLTRVLSVITAVAAVLIVFVFTRMTTVAKADGIPESVTIGGVTYTADNKLQVLEIVPDEAYDELGLIIGDSEGSVSWDMLVARAPKGASKESELNKYITDYIYSYNGFMNVLCANSGYHIKYKNKNNGKIYAEPWSISLSEIQYDLNNIELVACVQDNNWQYQEYKTDDGHSIRNIFGYIIFGSVAMEDKMELKVMKANDVTKSDIDRAGLVYINGQSHDSTMINLYNKFNNKEVSNSLRWKLNEIDMKAEVAYYLYESNVKRGKALIIGSTDKNPTYGTYSNVTRMALLQCGIDGDTFITDFAYKKVSDSKYTGARGEVRFEDNTFNVYLNTSVGAKRFPFVADMFVNDTIIEGQYGYAPNGNKVSYYPAYNATSSNFQFYLNNYTYVFNSDTCMTSSLTAAIGSKSDYDYDGKYLGSSYDDAAARLDKSKDDITSGNVICYILGDYAKPDIKEIKVLEIEPVGVYRYTEDSDKELIKKWFGLTTKDSVNVSIENVSMNAFIGMNNDICSDYDLIILGGYTNDKLIKNVWGNTYNNGNTAYGLNGNDITQKAYDKLLKYARTGLPLVIDDALYYGDTGVVDADTLVYGFRITELTKKLLAYGNTAGNITHVDVAADSGYQSIPRTLIYKNKPDCDVSSSLPEYTGLNSALANRSQLSAAVFSGNFVREGNYRIKIYIDRNCDGIYSEDYDSDDAELLYFAQDNNAPVRDKKTGEILGVEFSGGSFSVTLTLPSALSGYIGWKVEITDADTGVVKVKESAFAIQSYAIGKEIKVLQLIADDANNVGNLDLGEGSKFRECFNKTTATTGLKISVDTLSKKMFNKIDDKSTYLSKYSMLVLGLSDNYGNDLTTLDNKNFNDEAISAITNYIKKGNAVLFTHDTMSYKNSSGSEAGYEEGLNAFTKNFKPIIGMKDGYSITDTLRFKLNKLTPFTDVPETNSTRNTTKVDNLNRGSITEYPYSLADKTIGVSSTHGQYFALNLESYSGLAKPDNSDVVVWYTLSESDEANSKFFTYTGQDAMNNYYVYSKGNITYTSAGHSKIDSDNDEMKLFVNTFVRAMLSGNSLPEVKYDDATQESPELFTKYFRTDLSEYKDNLEITFSVNDPDLVDNIGRLSKVYLFYDKNNNDVYDTEDVIIGYFDADGNISPTMVSGKSVYCAKKYRFELWSAVKQLEGSRYSAQYTNELLTEMQQKLVNNKLRIGIVATDSSDANGFAVLKLVERKMFRLN